MSTVSNVSSCSVEVPPSKVPAEFAHPALQELVRIAGAIGSVNSEQLRAALVQAEINPKRMRVVLRSLNRQGIHVTPEMPSANRAVAAAASRATVTRETAAKQAVVKPTSHTKANPAKSATHRPVAGVSTMTKKAGVKIAAASTAINEHQPDLALIDIQLPDGDGLDLAATVTTISPATRIVVLTTFGRPGYLRRALDAGARGFLLKDRPLDELLAALNVIAGGGRVIDPDLALDALDSGVITIGGRDVTGVTPQRRGIGFVFQHYAAFKHMSVARNVAFGLEMRGMARAARDARVGEMLRLTRLDML